jgi:Leucine-rich repeat (LRR) protein
MRRVPNLLTLTTSCPPQAARDAVEQRTAQLRVLPSGDGQKRQKCAHPPGAPASALEQLLSVGNLVGIKDLVLHVRAPPPQHMPALRVRVSTTRAGPTTSFPDRTGPGDMARLLPRLAGSLEQLALPSCALGDLAGHLQRQQQPDGPQLGPQLAAQLTRLSALQLVCGPEAAQPLDAGSWAFVNALPALRHLRVWGNNAGDPALPAGLETLALSAYPNSPIRLDGIQRLTSLRGLSLRECRLSAERLAPLAACTRLTALDISGNKLTSLGPIAGLTSLTGARV